MGVVPVHDPGVATSRLFRAAVPVIRGTDVFAGRARVPVPVPAPVLVVTVEVSLDSAVATPPEFVALTWTRIVRPTSAVLGMYVDAVAPVMVTQFSPFVSQRRHWYVYVIGSVPVQVPVVAERTLPTRASPVTLGSVELRGGFATTTSAASAVTVLTPAVFVARTLI